MARLLKRLELLSRLFFKKKLVKKLGTKKLVSATY